MASHAARAICTTEAARVECKGVDAEAVLVAASDSEDDGVHNDDGDGLLAAAGFSDANVLNGAGEHAGHEPHEDKYRDNVDVAVSDQDELDDEEYDSEEI